MKSKSRKLRKGDRVKLRFVDQHDLMRGYSPGSKGVLQDDTYIPYVQFDNGTVECFYRVQLVRLVPKRGLK